jgi:hypothetical protein
MWCRTTEEDDSHLEVQVLSQDGGLFVHHGGIAISLCEYPSLTSMSVCMCVDITLPDFPLSLAWMDCPPFLAGQQQQAVGNYMAVGTFLPAIEIW